MKTASIAFALFLVFCGCEPSHVKQAETHYNRCVAFHESIKVGSEFRPPHRELYLMLEDDGKMQKVYVRRGYGFPDAYITIKRGRIVSIWREP